MRKLDNQQMGLQASQVIENPAFKEATKAVRSFYTEQMVNTKPEESEIRDHLHRCIHALTDVETALTAFIQSGKIEKQMAVKKERSKK
jgi:hypothetical protein